VGLACNMYADDNDEKFPSDLKKLMPDYVDNPKVYVCPGYAKHAEDGIDYAYVAGLKASDLGEYVLAYEPVGSGERKGVNVLFCDAHVEYMLEDQLKKTLAAQAEKLKKDGREMKLIVPQGVAGGGAPAIDDVLGEDALLALLKQLGNPATMPPPECITKHLFPGAASVRKVEGGLLMEDFGPLGFGGSLGGGGPQNVAAVSIIAAIAIPSLLAARRSSLETNAVGSCRSYCGAQVMYKRNDWDGDGVLQYAPDFAQLNTQLDGNGDPIQLLDAAFAGAKGPGGTPKHGYLFYNMKTIAGKKIDWVNDFALCAVPAQYGRTGFRTYIINTNGTVFGIDNGGKPVTDYPENPAEAGWVIAE
jgi:prepilin-type processing-associated H-X9-DG protein